MLYCCAKIKKEVKKEEIWNDVNHKQYAQIIKKLKEENDKLKFELQNQKEENKILIDEYNKNCVFNTSIHNPNSKIMS